jgi:hypothetical protein
LKNPCPFKPGSADFDAYYSGFESVNNSVDCFCHRRDEAVEAKAEKFKGLMALAVPDRRGDAA